LGDRQVQLQLHARTGLTKSQFCRRNLRQVRLLRLQIDHNGGLPPVGLSQQCEQIGLRPLRKLGDRAAQRCIAAVNDELVRRTHAALGRRGLERLAEEDGQYKDRVAGHAGKLAHDNASASILASPNQCELSLFVGTYFHLEICPLSGNLIVIDQVRSTS
jgi:hypothetical protein